MAELGKLGEIIAHKRFEVAERLASADLSTARPTTRCLVAAMGQPGARFIFEYKRRSPSEGMLSDALEPAAVARAYTGVADGMSVLTDSRFFGGSLADLAAARTVFDGPILAKDFIVDVRQVAEARIAGADAVLAILSVLDDSEASAVMAEAARLGMDVLVEVHDEPEMRRAVALGARLIGINNRDLKTFRTDLAVTERLAGMAGDALVISESGIATRADIDRLAPHVDGFLIGSAPMRSGDPHGEARALAFGRVKLCGLRTAADLDAAAPAAFAGLVFVPGTPRDVTLDAALNAIEGARNAPPLVAVFRHQTTDIISELPLKAIQLHNASYDARSVTGVETWRAESPGDEVQKADRIVFDSGQGGTGQTFDWSMIQARPELSRALLAGGIGSHNALAAQRLGAFAIDIGSAMDEIPGVKSHEKIAALFDILRPISRRTRLARCA
ncbi:MAG: bifunctional indole-3-glycerol-phosphate synthase TrpC/phosphoribosylanthranilate isomerase TrpF [Sphingomicrobium sp.]